MTTIHIKQIVFALLKSAITISLRNCNLFRHDIAEELLIFTLNNNHLLTPIFHLQLFLDCPLYIVPSVLFNEVRSDYLACQVRFI
jgi:hypothetical protein